MKSTRQGWDLEDDNASQCVKWIRRIQQRPGTIKVCASPSPGAANEKSGGLDTSEELSLTLASGVGGSAIGWAEVMKVKAAAPLPGWLQPDGVTSGWISSPPCEEPSLSRGS
jgi:hypothetical protein